MKKYTFISILFFIYSVIYAQARVNEPLPIISGDVKSLEFTGWMKDHTGQWRSAPKKIVSEYWNLDGDSELGWDNIVSLKEYKVAFGEREFVVLEVIKKTRQYEYPSIFAGPYLSNMGYYYIFEKSNFHVSVEPNQARVNNLNLYSSFTTLAPLTDSNRAEGLRNYVRESRILLNRLSWPTTSEPPKSLGIPTFFYTDENVIRFFINSQPVGDMEGRSSSKPRDFYDTLQDNFYYECSYDAFVDFFN